MASRYASSSLQESQKAYALSRSPIGQDKVSSSLVSIYSQVRGREELTRTGVYVLWNPSESGQLPRAYVGEGEALLNRLDSHIRNKDFWTHGVTFISKDQNLNKAHVQYLEARLVGLAADAKRCELDNGNVPQIPSLSDADAADAELYLADMLLCLPIVGVTFFEKPRTQRDISQDLFLSAKGITARGYEDTGGFVVRSGSQVVKKEVASIHPYLSNLRRALLSQGLLEDDGTVYSLLQDYVFVRHPPPLVHYWGGPVMDGSIGRIKMGARLNDSRKQP